MIGYPRLTVLFPILILLPSVSPKADNRIQYGLSPLLLTKMYDLRNLLNTPISHSTRIGINEGA